MVSRRRPPRPPGRPLTRRARARRRRERRQRYLLIGVVAAVIALALLIPAYGYYREYIQKGLEPIARVDGKVLSVGEYTKLLRYKQLPLQAQAQQLQQLGQNQPALSQQRQYLAQQIGAMPTQAVFDWAEDQVIRAEAPKLGVTVTAEDIDKELRKRVTGEDPEGEARATATAASWTPTPTAAPTDTPTPAPSPTPDPNATPAAADETPPAGTPSAGTPEASATATPGGATPTPTPKPDYNTLYSRYRDFFGLSDQDLRNFIENDVYRQKVGDAVRDQAPKSGPQVDVSLIRTADEVTATQALQRVQGGEDFGAVAKELSNHYSKDQGGALGWTRAGVLPAEVDAVAFQLPIGQISDVIKANDGYYILIVNGRDNDRPYTDSDLSVVRSKAFDDWLAARKKEHQIEYLITSDKQLWASDQNKKYLSRVGGGV